MLVYSKRAKEQMKLRGITKGEIKHCLNNYGISITPKEGCKQFFSNHPSGKRLKVVVDTKSNEIVTVVLLD